MERANNQDCQMVGMLDIKGKDQWRRVYSVDGIAPTLVTCQGGQQEVKIFDTKRLRVRKLTPKEYGILQAFPMDDWKQVVSDSQAYKQFGNAVTTTVFTAIAEEIAKSIYAAEESKEQNMEAENKNFTGMNEQEEKPTAESILAAAEAEAKVAAGREETTKTTIPAEETITPNSLANGMLQFLLDSGIVASACVTDETEKMFAKHIKEELDGITIGETPEILRDWEAAQNAVNDMLSKYAPGGYMGKIIYPLLTPLKERLEAGERTPDLYNAIVEATRQVQRMTLADIVAVMSGPDRVRITKGSNELFAGYLGNLVHMAEYEALMAEEVTRLKEKVDITHKRYKELGLMQPLHPEETPNYSFSDLQLTIYREIILKSEE